MGWIEAVVLGLVQGLTEFLPISSSAHLRVVGAAFGWEDPGAAFTAITEIGTEVAVLIYFRHDIWAIVRPWVLSLVRTLEPKLSYSRDSCLCYWLPSH